MQHVIENYQLAHEILERHSYGNFSFVKDDNRFFSSSVSVGAGKTFVAEEYMLAAEQALYNFVYVAPTKKLVEQTTKELKEKLQKMDRKTRNVNLIHSGTGDDDETTAEAALKAINETFGRSGAIVIITTATFLNILPLINRKKYWRVILDEAFSPLSFVEYKLGKKDPENSVRYFESLFRVDPNDKNLVRPAKGESTLVKAIASGDWDTAGTMYSPMQKLAKNVLNSALRVELAAKHADRYHFAAYVTPEKFEGFPEVIFLAALFEETILHKLWTSMYEVEFKPHPYFEETIKRNVHVSQGSLISVGHILYEGDYASRYNLMRNYETGEPYEGEAGKRVIDQAVNITATYLKGIPFLLHVNNWTGYHSGSKKSKVSPPENALLISGVPHGQNDYQQYKAIAAFSVTNPEQFQMEWVRDRSGMSTTEVYRAYRIHTVYQACGRTAIRNGDNSEPVVFLTIGSDDARFLHELFKGSTWLGQVGDLPRYKGAKPRAQDDPVYRELRKELKAAMKRLKRGTATQAEVDEVKQKIAARKRRQKS